MSSTSSTATETLNQDNVTKVTLEIENFQNISNAKNEGIKTKSFTLFDDDKASFTLYCNPNYRNSNYLGYNYVMIFLGIDISKVVEATVRYQISIVNEDGDKCETQQGVKFFSRTAGEMYGANLMILRDYILKRKNDLLVNGKLIIYCELETIIDAVGIIISEVAKPGLPDNQIVQDYQSLLENGKFSDASLIVKIGEKRLLVHKAILSARSKVFAAMFENDCEEKRENRVEIIDIPAEVCEQMLSYIYTGKIPDLSEYAADLFIAADKYELEHLKTVCEEHLTTTLCIESVANTLLVADMHHATLLKSKCIDYITDNLGKVMDTDGWKALTVARIELTLDLLKKLAIKN